MKTLIHVPQTFVETANPLIIVEQVPKIIDLSMQL